MPEQYDLAASVEQVLDDLRHNYDFYDPVAGIYLMSFIDDARCPDLFEDRVSVAAFKRAIETLEKRSIEYRDGTIAPYELFCDAGVPVTVDFAGPRILWTVGDPEEDLEALAAKIACGGWIRVGADLEQFIASCEDAIARAYDQALRSWERQVERRPGSRAVAWEFAVAGHTEPMSVASAASMFCDQLRTEFPEEGEDIPTPDGFDVLFEGWVREHEEDGVFMSVEPACAARRASRCAEKTCEGADANLRNSANEHACAPGARR